MQSGQRDQEIVYILSWNVACGGKIDGISPSLRSLARCRNRYRFSAKPLAKDSLDRNGEQEADEEKKLRGKRQVYLTLSLAKCHFDDCQQWSWFHEGNVGFCSRFVLKTDVTSSRDIPEILAPRENPDEGERKRERRRRRVPWGIWKVENRILENVFRGVLAREKC